MAIHIFVMTKDVEKPLEALRTQWAKGLDGDAKKVKDGDVVVLLGHGGGLYTVQFIQSWKGLIQDLSPKGKAFVMLMCGQGQDGGSAQVAELIVKDGAKLVVYCEKTITMMYVMDMPADLGLATWADLFKKEDGETWKIGKTTYWWTCLSNANGPSLVLKDLKEAKKS